jgi:hypothetical protein
LLQKAVAPGAEVKPAPEAKKPAADVAAKPAAEPEKKAEDKPADKPAAEAKPAEAKAAEPAKLEPVAYEYTVPDSVKIDDATKTELHGAMDAFRGDPVKGFQKLMDLHTKSMEQYAKDVDKRNREVFMNMRRENVKAIMDDPQMGGNGFKTTEAAVARMRDMLVRPQFLAPRKFDDGSPRPSVADEFFEYTGAGEHPVMWDILHNAARYLDEPTPPPPNPRPTKVKAPGGGLYNESSRAKMNG